MNNSKKQGMVLVLVVVVMSAMLLLVTYFLNFVITENKIARSHYLATEDYYLAEAGIQEAIWKLNNDPEWLNSFQTDSEWQATLERENPFGDNQSYAVTIVNYDLGRAEIIAASQISQGSRQSQRVVKTVVFQPQGGPPPAGAEDAAIFTDSDVNFSGSVTDVLNGGIFANDDINLTFFSDVNVEGKASAGNRISIPWGSSLTASEMESSNYPPPPESREMPQVDFNSEDPNSYINQADYVYSTSQFNHIFDGDPNVVLNGIIYVTGNITIPRGYTLTVNGVLLAEGNVNLGTDWWPFWESGPSLVINDPGVGPAGLLSMRKIHFASEADLIDITGLIYAADELKLDWLSPGVDLTGGVIVRKMTVSNFFNQITLNFDADIVARTLGNPSDAPLINVEHWEEEY